jgi:ABC-type transport system substrate-binding protein
MSNNYWGKFAAQRLSRRRALQLAATSGAAAAFLAACGSDDGGSSDGSTDTGTPTTTGATGTPQPGGRYASYFATIGNYNVMAFYHDGYNNSGITVYDRPITARVDAKGYNLEAMAKIEVAEPTKIVMTLKPGMVFQNKAPVNGRKVLASDIVESQNYVRTLPQAENSNFQRTFLDRVEAPDDTTVVYHLKQPSAYLFSSTYLANPTSQPIVPKEMLAAMDSTPAVGSGPFELVDHTFGQKYTYKKFDNFREAKGGMPYFTEREIFSLTDSVAQEAAFRSGQISEWLPPTSIVDRLTSELDKTKFTNASYLNTQQIGINAMMNAEMGGPRPWHDVRVREAMYKLTNKEQWVTLGYNGRAVANKGPLQAGLDAWHIDAKTAEPFYKEDVQAANQLLSAANYDKGKEWEIVCSNSSPTNATLAEIWQQQLGRGGFKFRIVSLPNAEILPKKMNVSLFDFWVGAQPGGDTPARAMRNNHSNTNDQFNNVGLFNKEVDAMIEKSEVQSDRNENIKLVKEIQKKILELYTLSYNVVTDQRYVFYDAKLQDFLIDPLTGQDYQYQAWLKA